jgi:D-alanine--poly(phosphoribitol) ligase subunit 1
MLACLRLGAIYVCLDPKSPEERTGRILRRVEPKVLVAENAPAAASKTRVVVPGQAGFDMAAWPAPLAASDLAREPVGLSPAYLMFTSGSTGEPKGAVMPHIGVQTLMRWGRAVVGGDPDAHRFTAINPLHFDNSVFDFYCGLVNGATLVPIETAKLASPEDWVLALNRHKASVAFAVPTVFLLLDKAGKLTPEALPSVRRLLFGGEGFPIDHLRAFHDRFRGHARLTNVYGPTETSCICSSIEVDDASLASPKGPFVSLGRMHEGFEHAVLDPAGAPVPVGEAGELWIGGPCVGLGYYNQPEETARRFQQDPRQAAYRAIFYRTGDLVREDEAGLLWFIGRADNQVKIAGHRIELEEIDAVVQGHAAVRRAVAVVTGSGEERSLAVAFETKAPLDAEALAAWCRARLPVYMLPRRFVSLPQLPLNANGKVDRLKAAAMVQEAPAPVTNGQAGDVSSAGAVSTLQAIWAEALNLPAVPTDANFFDLGGTSLLLVQIHAAIKARLGRDLALNDLFANPTLDRLERFLSGAQEGNVALDQARARGRRQEELLQRLRKTPTSVPQ